MENQTGSMKKCTISLDNKVEDVVELDQENELFFESAPGKFLELPQGIIEKLSARSKSNYFAAFHSFKMESKREEVDPLEGIKVDLSYAEAGKRIEVEASEGFKKKYHTCWKRPEQLQTCLSMGYSFVTGADGVKTYAYDKKRDRHVVGVHGHEELYLMKIPQGAHMQMLREVERKSKHNNGVVEEAATEEMRQLGGKPDEVKKRLGA